jgi:hypothetical protein
VKKRDVSSTNSSTPSPAARGSVSTSTSAAGSPPRVSCSRQMGDGSAATWCSRPPFSPGSASSLQGSTTAPTSDEDAHPPLARAVLCATAMAEDGLQFFTDDFGDDFSKSNFEARHDRRIGGALDVHEGDPTP